jgi:glucarate dehydratase
MRIDAVETRVVRVPLSVPFSSSVGTRAETTRTVVRIRTDAGLEGIGETFRGRETAAVIQELAPHLIGTDPTRIEAMLRRFRMTPFFYGYVGFAALAGLEVACWDLLGKQADLPLSTLLGGRVRDHIPVSGLVFQQPKHEGISESGLGDAMADDARLIVESQGVKVIKLKGSHQPERDLQVLEALERTFQGEVKLRLDPNAAWTVAETLRALPRLEVLTLDYLEDPVQGLDAMARVRAETHLPLATNMCVVKPDDLPAAFRLGTVDVILADAYKWGGITPTRKLAGACEFLGLSMAMHSGSELGISTAAHLHVAAATPIIDHAMDTTLSLQLDDVIQQRFDIADGAIAVPGGPGLGVQVDEDKLERYSIDRAECREAA